MSKLSGNIKAALNYLVGDAGEFSMENRAFNYVCLISVPILIYGLLFDFFVSQTIMSYVLIVCLFLLAAVYYFSRFKKLYNTGIIFYGLLSYIAIILNYYTNSGIKGPTINYFLLTFLLLVAIGRRRLFPLWLTLHITVAASLMYYEYNYPQKIPFEYHNMKELMIDIMASFIIAIGYIFSITTYLRRSFENERNLANERAHAISLQNIKITEQNQELEKVNDERNKLFSIVSHDLKAPLDSIRGYLSLLSENLIQGDEKLNIEKELLEQTNYTSELLINLLSWAKTQMQGVTINLVPVRIDELIEETISHKMTFALKKGIRLSYSVNPGLGVIGDRDMLHIVLRNLLNNALKFTDTGGEVVLRSVSKGDKVTICIQDNGIGIPQEKHKDLFTLKTHVSYGTNNEKGTGLGLMMCKEFMQFQHGEISFESAVGKGSTFCVSLPASPASQIDIKVRGQNVLSEN